MTLDHVANGRIAPSQRFAPAHVAYGATLLFVLLVLVLHGIKPEIDPSWRFISELALGRHGWLMSTAFLTFAFAHLALVAAIEVHLRGSGPGRFAKAFLVISAAGLAVAGVFTTDAVTTDPAAVTASGRLHNFGGAMGIAMPLAVALVTWQLLKRTTSAAIRRAILGSSLLAVVGAVVSTVALGILLTRSGGVFGPDVPVGWPNRLELGTYCIWFLTVAWYSRGVPERGQN